MLCCISRRERAFFGSTRDTWALEHLEYHITDSGNSCPQFSSRVQFWSATSTMVNLVLTKKRLGEEGRELIVETGQAAVYTWKPALIITNSVTLAGYNAGYLKMSLLKAGSTHTTRGVVSFELEKFSLLNFMQISAKPSGLPYSPWESICFE